MKITVILGASTNPERYSYKALQALRSKGHPVIAIGKSGGTIDGIEIHKEMIAVENTDTITLYLNPAHQLSYYNYILSLHPKRIIFNPGTENPELVKIAQNNDIDCVIGCTLVMLSTGQY